MSKQLTLKLLNEKIIDFDKNAANAYNNLKKEFRELKNELKASSIETTERINVIENLSVVTSNELLRVKGDKPEKVESAYPARHYQDWTEQEKGSLEAKIRLICRDRAKQHQRTKRAIAWKIREYLTSENIIRDFPEF